MLISCLMVTAPHRRERALAAARAFARQTHVLRELVVVIAGGDAGGREETAAALAAPGVTAHVLDAEPSLGTLRNVSVACASGDAICQWDDDDLYHPDRLAAQLAALGDADATVLQDVLMFDAVARELRWLNWAGTPLGGHPGTLLCRRAAMPAYPETGDAARLGEDRVVLEALLARGGVALHAGAPHLYGYVTHGTNSYDAGHHAMLARELALSAGLVRRRESMLRAGAAGLDFGTGPVTVHGSGGPAFTLA